MRMGGVFFYFFIFFRCWVGGFCFLTEEMHSCLSALCSCLRFFLFFLGGGGGGGGI